MIRKLFESLMGDDEECPEIKKIRDSLDDSQTDLDTALVAGVEARRKKRRGFEEATKTVRRMTAPPKVATKP